MKKALLSFIFASAIVTLNAQDMMSKRGTPILPEANDWSIGFDVVPVLKSAGHLFHNPSGNDSIYSENKFTLVGLYVKNEHTIYRLKVRLGQFSAKYNNLVTNDLNLTAKLTDTWTESSTNITIGGGIQKSRGKGRLHGIYGGEAAIMLGSHGHTFTYGNEFTTTNQTPTTTDFKIPLAGGGFTTAAAASRPTEISDGFLFGFQINGFIGAEYFFAPKMSLSAEYGWGLMYNSNGEASSTEETWTGGSGGNKTTLDNKIAKSTAVNLDVINAASVIFHLYF